MGEPATTQRLDVLERQMQALRQQVQAQSEWIDTVSTPLWKRLWFVAQGYHFNRLGRWYRAPWNADAAQWDRQP